MKFITLLAATLLTIAGCSDKQLIEDGSMWNFGRATMTAELHADTIVLRGGTLHEGGILCCLVPKADADSMFTLLPYPSDPDNKWTYWERANSGQTVRLMHIDTLSMLVACNDKGNAVEVGIKYDGNLLREQEAIVRRKLEGTYTCGDDEEYSFFFNGTANINGQPMRYNVCTSFEQPTQLIALSDSTHLGFQTSPDSLTLRKAVYVDEVDEWNDYEQPIFRQLRWTSSTGNSKHRIRWDFITSRPLTVGELSYYSDRELRQLMAILTHQKDWGAFGALNIELTENELKYRLSNKE